MRRASGIGLTAWLITASLAVAQVPRDPLATPPPTTRPSSNTSDRPEPAPFVTKQNDVEIPFNVRAGTSAESQPSSVRIFISWDRGKSWHFYDERKPDDARFRFRAKQDGEYWFATQTLDRSGKPDSAEPRRPQLRLIIDSQRPKLLVQAHVTASGTMNLSWSAADATLIPSSLKLEYQDAGGSGGPWQGIDSNAPPGNATTINGQTTFQPLSSSNTINMRAEIADSAGNMAYYSQRIALIPPKPKETGNSLAHDPSATPWNTNKSASQETRSQIAAESSAPRAGQSEQVKIPGGLADSTLSPGRLASSPSAVDTLPPMTPPTASSNSDWRPSQSLSSAPFGQSNAESLTPPASVEDLPTQPAPPSSEPMLSPPAEIMPTPPLPSAAEPVDPTTAQHPRLTNSRRFSLDYDIQSVGPEGVAAVELWGTSDSGQSWTKWGTDPDRASPFDVEVSREAVYGFKIVIVGKNGLATSTPQGGDAADIWVSVDLTRPTAKLTGAVYGQGPAAGKLDIRWQAEDANLGSRPVTLSISDRSDGRFTPIATALPNTGEYFWEYDPRSPRQIYLRLEVRDDAGNITIDQLREPIKVEGLEPKGQIRGIKPGNPTNRGSFRSPVFR